MKESCFTTDLAKSHPSVLEDSSTQAKKIEHKELLQNSQGPGEIYIAKHSTATPTLAQIRGGHLTLSLTRRVHCGGWGKWAVVLWTINLKEESGLTLGRYCFHKMVPELLSMPKSLPEAVTITIIFWRLNSSLARVSMLISFLI